MRRAFAFGEQIVAALGMLLFVAASTPAQPRTVRIEEPEEGAIHWLLLPTCRALGERQRCPARPCCVRVLGAR